MRSPLGSEYISCAPVAERSRECLPDPMHSDPIDGPIDDRRLARLRWRCRRGMLENDLVLARYLDARGASLRESEVAMLDSLLELPDGELWALIAGTAPPADPAMAPLLEMLRQPLHLQQRNLAKDAR